MTSARRDERDQKSNPDGQSIVFRLEDIEVPAAVQPGRSRHPGAEIFPQGRRSRALKKVEENSVPSWLWRSVADEEALAELPEDERYGSETDARQVFDRLAGTWTYWGWKGGYFDPKKTPAPSSTSWPTCWPPSASRRTPRNGSTPACTGPTASTVPARATSMSTPSPAS
jgi:hypothetical protein